jgi:hypothetical protein
MKGKLGFALLFLLGFLLGLVLLANDARAQQSASDKDTTSSVNITLGTQTFKERAW